MIGTLLGQETGGNDQKTVKNDPPERKDRANQKRRHKIKKLVEKKIYDNKNLKKLKKNDKK